MVLSRTVAFRRDERSLWLLQILVTLLVGILLIHRSVPIAPPRSPRVSAETVDQGQWSKEHLQQLRAPSHSRVLGKARLDMGLLAQTYTLDEADNVRWSLVRRTPRLTEIYRQETGVDWEGLRDISESGTILLPASFTWSFNETFRDGPGYKIAGGILAGGHCALATAFRAAAMDAGLPTEARPHAIPVPGFHPKDSVNIYWGRDDLTVHNTSGQALMFRWKLAPQHLEVVLIPARSESSSAPMPDWQSATVAMIYGHPGPGGWGTLGQTSTVDEAIDSARAYAERVDQWNGARPVVIAINPNLTLGGMQKANDLYLYHLIAEARRLGFYVMLDIQTGRQLPKPLFGSVMDKFMLENVWLDWDLEHTYGQINGRQINRLAADYFAHRQTRGYVTPGIFAFYIFDKDQVLNPAYLQRVWDRGWVIPIFDGYGGEGPNTSSDKVRNTFQVLEALGEGPYGIMEFESRWGNRYDQIRAEDYFAAFPTAQLIVSQ